MQSITRVSAHFDGSLPGVKHDFQLVAHGFKGAPDNFSRCSVMTSRLARVWSPFQSS